jgi:hypothetical protein
MPGAKIVVLYPQPTDVEAFERAYVEEHIPLAKAKIGGATKFTFTAVRGAVVDRWRYGKLPLGVAELERQI